MSADDAIVECINSSLRTAQMGPSGVKISAHLRGPTFAPPATQLSKSATRHNCMVLTLCTPRTQLSGPKKCILVRVEWVGGCFVGVAATPSLDAAHLSHTQRNVCAYTFVFLAAIQKCGAWCAGMCAMFALGQQHIIAEHVLA